MVVGNLPAHWRVEFSGTIGVAPWATTLALFSLGSSDPDNYDENVYAQGMADQFRTFWNAGLANLNCTDTAFTKATVRWYQANSTAAYLQASAGPAGATVGNQTVSGPASQACCVTIYTAHPGKTGRGRMYLPATAALGSSPDLHRFKAADLSALSDAVQAFFIGVNGISPDSSHIFAPAVASVKDGAVRIWSRQSVDARPDSQEHRERHLSFTRITKNAPS